MKKRILSFILVLCMAISLFPAVLVYAASNEQQIYNYLTGTMGLNRAAACGVLANIEKESSFNPNALGDGGTSYGICQWHNSRWDALKNYCNNHGYDWTTLNGQLHYLESELKASNNYHIYAYLTERPDTEQGAYDAAYYWCVHFEVPADKYNVAVTRGNLAKNTYWPKYGGSTVDTSTPGKPVLTGMKSSYASGESVKFTWAATENTTHYQLWILRLDSNGEWKTQSKNDYVSSGFEKSLNHGIYKAYLNAYNKNAWEDGNTDWKHTKGDEVIFICDYASGSCGSGVSWRLKNGILSIRGTGSVADYEDDNTVPWYYVRNQIKKAVVAEGITRIGTCNFYMCHGLTDVELPSTLTSIGKWAFDNCINLEKIVLPEGLADVDMSVFLNCYGLKDVTIPSTLTYIGDYMFDGCKAMTRIVIPKTVTSIGNSAFLACYALTDVYYGGTSSDWTAVSVGSDNSCLTEAAIHYNGVDSGKCGDNAKWSYDGKTLTITGTGAMADYEDYNDVPWTTFRNEITKVVVSEGITRIGTHNFYMCHGLTNVELPSTLTSIGKWAFDNCINLEKIVLPEGLTDVEMSIFLNCYGLKDVTIPSTLTYFSDYMFDGCKAMTHIVIPKTITSIGNSAFLVCNALTDVYYGGTSSNWKAISIGSENGCLTNAAIHYNGADSGKCGDNAEWSYDGRTLTITGTGPMADYEDDKDVPWMAFRDRIARVVVNEGITRIGTCNFYMCHSLTDVELPSTLTSIGKWAFDNCISLEKIVLPEGLTDVDMSVFLNCYELKDVTIPSTLTYIGDYMFDGCESLCSITIPDSISIIGDSAFLYCTSLSNVYYMGTFEEWNAIPVGDNNDWLLESTIHFNTHTHSYIAAITSPTCTEQGYTTYTCSCGDSYVDDYTDALGHDFGEWSVTTAPTCTEKGVETRWCSRCDTYETREIDAFGHNYVDGKCTRCGADDPDYIPVSNAGKLVVSDARARAGEEVTISVSIEDNPGIMVMALGIDYDRTKLELIGYEDGIMTGWKVVKTAVWIGSDDVTANGVILKLKFKVLEDVEDGDIQVSLLFSEGDIANHDEEIIMPGISAGTITVYTREPGDVTGDGKVNALDLVRLQRYLSGEDVVIGGSCDITGDGKINALDLVRLQRYLSGEDVAIF